MHQDGTKVAQYEYDAWGNYGIETNVNGIATANPFRYRGYYMDAESDYYYLQTRYYSPVLRRFLSSYSYGLISTLAELCDLNLYAYANNKPIGIAYGKSGVSGRIGTKVAGLFALGTTFILGFESNNKGFDWPNLDFLGTGFGYIENTFSLIAGVIDGIRNIKNLDKLPGLDKASKWLMGIGIGINGALSIYNNLTNSYLTGAQKAGNIFGDVVFIVVSGVATGGMSALTVLIPVVGPLIAPIVGFGFGTAFDQFWHGEEILGIDGFSLNPGGKSIDAWIKDLLTELFGG